MSNQSASSHSRYVPLFHYVGGLLVIAIFGGAIVNFIHADAHTHYSAALILCISILLLIVYWYARAFALKAQDRAIRAEENFRHFILTGKPLPKDLRMGQIVALRFASDEEFPSLTQQAVSEKLSSKQIKLAIKNWKPDYNRV
jgi:hypothetical protein